MKKLKDAIGIIFSLHQSTDGLFRKLLFLDTFLLHYSTKAFFGKAICKIPEMNFDLHGSIINTRRNTIDFWAAIEMYEPEFTQHLLNEEDQGTFIDVGTHIGRYSILMAKKGWDVHSFEPVSSTFAQLKKNVSLNHTNSNTTLHNIALGSKKDTMKVMFDNAEHGQASLVETAGDESETVKVNTLDNVFNRKIEGKVILKIDVEGFEHQVLLGAKKFINQNNPIISIEIWDKVKSEKTVKLLQELGYEPTFAEFWEKKS